MNKSAIQKQLHYIVAKEQYLKPLLESGEISEGVYNEVLDNLYNDFEIWRYSRIANPRVEFAKKMREPKQNLSEKYLDFISLTNIARTSSDKSPGYVIQSWFRDKNTVAFLSLWEKKHNNKFFDCVLKSGTTLPPKIWIKKTNSVGIVSRQGKNGGTYAHKEIAMHFMCWVSADMMLKVIERYLEVMNDEKGN